MTKALFTHHHYGWRKHDLPNSHEGHLISALTETHDFLAQFEGQYLVKVERTPACSHDGEVHVLWDDDSPKQIFGGILRKGDYWFRAFEFNVADAGACCHCGGTGMDHYDGPFYHCWACDGIGVKVRDRAPAKKLPTRHCLSPIEHEKESRNG